MIKCQLLKDKDNFSFKFLTSRIFSTALHTQCGIRKYLLSHFNGKELDSIALYEIITNTSLSRQASLVGSTGLGKNAKIST